MKRYWKTLSYMIQSGKRWKEDYKPNGWKKWLWSRKRSPREAADGVYRSNTEQSLGKFFADHKRVGRGTAPSKANAARSGRYDRDITIESGEIWKRNENPDIGCIGKICSSIGKAYRASVKWWRMKSQEEASFSQTFINDSIKNNRNYYQCTKCRFVV